MSNDDEKREREKQERVSTSDREERERRRTDEDGTGETTGGDNATGDEETGSARADETPDEGNRPAKSDSKSTETVHEGRDEEQLDVPQVDVEASPRLDSEALAGNLSTETGRAVDVPQFSIPATAFLQARELEDTVVVREGTNYVGIPQFEPSSTTWLDPVELADDQPDAIELARRAQIPQVTIGRSDPIDPLDTFLVQVPDTVESPSVEEAETTDEEDEKAVATQQRNETASAGGAESRTSGGGRAVEKWPDPLELMFGPGGGELSTDEPIVVCVNDTEENDFVAILETLVKRLYREKVGGTPNPHRFSTAEELVEETRWVEAEGNIFTVKLDDEEWKELEGDLNEDWERIWRSRIRDELYAEDFGAIIFNRYVVDVSSAGDHYPKIIHLNPPTPSFDAQKTMIRLFWGCWDDSVLTEGYTFGQLFNIHGERSVERRWSDILGAERGVFMDAAQADESAGELHRRIKALVVRWLVERLREQGYELTTPTEIEEEIETEREFRTDGAPEAIADVYCTSVGGSPKGVFEIETLFAEDRGAGRPRDKLRSSFRKYEDVSKVDEINIVLDNLSVMLHFDTIAHLKYNHRDWEEIHSKDVNFYTLDLEDDTLVRVKSVVDDMKALEEVELSTDIDLDN